MLAIHITEYNESYKFGKIQLTYDISDDFTNDQIATLQHWTNEINSRFPNLKIVITGTGYFKPEESEE